MVWPDYGIGTIPCSIDGANPANITDLTQQQGKQHKGDGTVGVRLFKQTT